eukprot:COSAG02_NODE_67075_length_254_cov_0.483871_1_plen_27_part_01
MHWNKRHPLFPMCMSIAKSLLAGWQRL